MTAIRTVCQYVGAWAILCALFAFAWGACSLACDRSAQRRAARQAAERERRERDAYERRYVAAWIVARENRPGFMVPCWPCEPRSLASAVLEGRASWGWVNDLTGMVVEVES